MATSTASPTTYTVENDDTTVVYDVRGPLPPTGGELPLFMFAQPMDASGFGTLAGLFGDRTIITYDPRGGVGRTVRKDGRQVEVRPEDQADDIHAVITAVGGTVDVLASSGGAVTALALVAAHPQDVRTLVAHEPPLIALLPDAEAAFAAERAVQQLYRDRGWGAGMAAFIGLTSWQGEFTEAYLESPAPDPAQFGLPTEDDGNRSDPLLSGIANAITGYRPDVAAVTAAPTRVVIAAGVESRNTLTWRSSEAAAAALGLPLTEFPSHHGGFLGPGFGPAGQPEAFAARLREVLAGTS
jgi:pimeloyl-ACP methyl ester carboxylesterase